MTVLDPRLFPLLETLAGAGVDWLAFEIVDGIRRGREPLEPEDLLRAARERVRSRQPAERQSADIPVLAKPILGDDQIVWAADYVAARLDAALSDLDEGCAMIEAVAENSGNASTQEERAIFKVTPSVPVEFTLIGHGGHPVDRGSIAVAREWVEPLRKALALWSSEARSKSIP